MDLALKEPGVFQACNIKWVTVYCLALRPEVFPPILREDLGDQQVIRLPMQPDSRSINLSNAVSIVSYEAWRQLNFIGSKTVGNNEA